MKLKKIAQLCNKEKIYVLYDKPYKDGITQWLGDGRAAYPLDGMPLLDEESLCKMFDISEKRRDKLVIRQMERPKMLCMEDTDPGEVPVKSMKLEIFHEGKDLLPLTFQEGVVFIQRKYLSPFDGEEELVELYARKTGGQTYIAVKNGLLLRALIMPVNMVTSGFVDRLSDLFWECKRQMEKSKLQGEEGAFQLSWTEEEPGSGTT